MGIAYSPHLVLIFKLIALIIFHEDFTWKLWKTMCANLSKFVLPPSLLARKKWRVWKEWFWTRSRINRACYCFRRCNNSVVQSISEISSRTVLSLSIPNAIISHRSLKYGEQQAFCNALAFRDLQNMITSALSKIYGGLRCDFLLNFSLTELGAMREFSIVPKCPNYLDWYARTLEFVFINLN
jgi:hypothetical protein